MDQCQARGSLMPAFHTIASCIGKVPLKEQEPLTDI